MANCKFYAHVLQHKLINFGRCSLGDVSKIQFLLFQVAFTSVPSLDVPDVCFHLELLFWFLQDSKNVYCTGRGKQCLHSVECASRSSQTLFACHVAAETAEHRSLKASCKLSLEMPLEVFGLFFCLAQSIRGS